MTRRIFILVLGLATALLVGIGVMASATATAALPPDAAPALSVPSACGTPGPWSFASALPTAVFGAMTTSDGTYVYSAGGYSFQLPGPTSQFLRFDPAANSWITLAALPAADYNGAAMYANGKVYVFGGTDGATVSSSTYIYDIASNSWSVGAPLPAPREQMGIGFSGGKVYIAGGSDSQSINPQSTLYSFDVTANSWATLAAMPQALTGPGSGAISGHLYIAGGRDVSVPNRSTVYDYNIGSNSWSTVASLLTGVNAPGSAVVGGDLAVFGGGTPFSDPIHPSLPQGNAPLTSNFTELYDPPTNTWISGPSLNTARSFVGGASVGQELVAVGGYDGSTSLSSVEVSQVPCGTPTPTPTGGTSTPTNTPSPTATRTSTPTSTRTPTITVTYTPSPTRTPTNTATHTPTGTSTTIPTATHTSVVPTITPTVTRTATGIAPSATNTPALTATNTPTNIPTSTNTPTDTNTPLPTQTPGGPSATPVPSDTSTTVPTATGTPVPPTPGTAGPTNTPTNTPVATATACTLTFRDVPSGSTFYPYIHCMACKGIINGYPDGTFRPNNNVTRGQLSKIVSNSAGFSDPQPNQMFQDVPLGSTFQVYISRLASRGYISGYPCGGQGEPCIGPSNLPYFRPNANATRGQISKIVSNAAEYNDTPSGQQFQDVPIGSTYYAFIYRLASRDVMQGYPCGQVPTEPCIGPGNLPYFRPNNNATRGQTSKIVANTFFPNCNPR